MALSGCADNADKVQATYASPLTYKDYNCKQIEQEARRISSRASQAAGVQDKNAKNDKIATGVAVVLFFPAALLVGGNKGNTSELARLKGELDAIEQASIQKECGLTFRAPKA